MQDPKQGIHGGATQEKKKAKKGGGGGSDDIWSILLLLLLYTVQGIPMGLSSSIPFILQAKVHYTDQATFSLVSWPFSLKLLWAPLVDSLFVAKFGRRKSWLVPVQLICAAMMIGGSSSVHTWLGEAEGATPNVFFLTLYFFVLYMMMATQDIAVDGWALTMLSKDNVAYASTCNSVGQTLGYFLAYVGFLALYDPVTCNAYFRAVPQDTGMITLPGFLTFWGYVILLTTVGVALFKRERVEEGRQHAQLTVRQTYNEMWSVMRLPAIRELTLVLLTCKIGFSAAEAVAPLKLVEYGLPKEKLALLSPVLIPLGIVLPIALSRFSSTKPWKLFLWGYPFRLAIGLLYALIVYVTPDVMQHTEEIHVYYYAFILLSGALHELAANMMFVSVMSFYATISDPAIGGTYMTYLNTVTNMGTKWPNSLALFLVDYLSRRECRDGAPDAAEPDDCPLVRDGFFVETGICLGIGLLWLLLFYHRVQRIQALPLASWRVVGGGGSQKKKKL